MKSHKTNLQRSFQVLVTKVFRCSLSLLVAGSLLISFAQISVFQKLVLSDVHAADGTLEDNVITSIELINPKQQYTIGDTVSISFTFEMAYAQDAIIYVELFVLNLDEVFAKGVTLNYVDGYTWVFSYKITDLDESGNYQVRTIVAYDEYIWKYYKSSQYYPDGMVDFSTTSFIVVGTNGDRNPPIIESLSVDSRTMDNSDVVMFDFSISDPSGPARMEIFYQMGDSNIVRYVAACSVDNIGCSYYIKEYDPSGLWQVAYVVLRDTAIRQNVKKVYNEALYPNEEFIMNFDAASFTVMGTTTDITAPILNNLTLSSNSFHINETLRIEADITDDLSRCGNTVITYVNNETGYLYPIDLYPIFPTHEYNFLKSGARPGNYSIQKITLRDLAQNVRVLYNQELFSQAEIGPGGELHDFSMYDLVIYEAYFEDVSSWIPDVTVSATDVYFGQEVQFSFQPFGELSQAEYIRVIYDVGYIENPVDDIEVNQYLELYKNEDGCFSGNFRYMTSIYGIYRPLYLKYWIAGEERRIYDLQNLQSIQIADLSNFELTINQHEIVDTTPPVLDTFTIDLHEPQIGDTIQFTISAHDDESEIVEYTIGYRIDGVLRDEFSSFLPCQSCEGEQIFGKQVNQYELNGLWEVDFIQVASYSSYIRYRNPKYYPNETHSIDFSQLYFIISGAIEDHNPAQINSISLNTSNAYPMDTIEITASIDDDISGVESMSIEYRNEMGSTLNAVFELNDATNAIATLKIPELTRPGIWEAIAIFINDKAGNNTLYTNMNAEFNYCNNVYYAKCVDLSFLDITVNGEIDDFEGPKLTTLSTEFSTYTNRGTANIKLVVEDVSRIQEIRIEYSTPIGIQYFYATMYENDDLEFNVYMSIPTHNSQGNWMLTRVFLTDIYGNKTTYIDSPFVDLTQFRIPLDAGDFTVIGNNAQPTVLSIDSDLETATIGEMVKVTMDLKDDIIKPDTIEAKMTNFDLSSQTVLLTKQTDETYIGFFLVGEFTSNGTWFVESMIYTDRYGMPFEINNIQWNPFGVNSQDLSNANFEVYGTNTDIVAPEITNVAIENASLNTLMNSSSQNFSMSLLSGAIRVADGATIPPVTKIFSALDRIKFLVEASDEISGLESIFVTYQVYRKKISFTIDMNLNDAGIYEGEVQIESYHPQGNWSLVYFEASDAAGNKFVKTKDEIEFEGTQIGLNRLHFYVNNPNEDKSTPVLTDLTLNSSLLKEGETLVLTAHAFDTQSGIESFKITLMPYYYNEEAMAKEITMYLMDDGSYQGEMIVTENIIGSWWGVKDIVIMDRAYNKFEQHNSYMYPDYIANKKIMTEYDFSVDCVVFAELISLPTKLTYRIGEAIDLTGIKVMGHSMDGDISEVVISETMLYNFDTSSETEEQQVYLIIDETYVSFTIKVVNQADTTPPIISITDYDSGWTNESLCVYASVNEGSLNNGEHCFHENGNFEFVATDEAGNESRQTVTITNIDKSAPVISVDQNLKFTLNSTGLLPYLAFDLESGLVGEESRVLTVDTTKVGAFKTNIIVMDQAGNVTVAEVNYHVVYDFLGFMQPINTNGTSIFKAGSTIPIKFKLNDALGISQGDAIASLTVTQLGSTVDGIVNELPINISASSTAYFRYDELSGQYILNLSTKGYPAGSYRLSVVLNDGVIHSIEIGLKK